MRFLQKLGIRAASLLLRNSPFETGRYRLIHTFLPQLRSRGAEMGAVTVGTRHGFRFEAYLNDWLGQYVYLTGTYEPATAALFERLVAPGSTVLDLGANAGFFSLLSARLAGPGGRVIAFEPAPRVRQRLSRNIELNDFGNIRIMACCVSDGPGEVTLHEGPENHTGISSMRPIEAESGSILVPAVAVDSLLDEISTVSLVKIDVEGAELMALKGLKGLLARDKPSLIVEITDTYLRAFGDNAPALAEWMSEQGFSGFRIDEGALTPLSLAELDRKSQFNALFVADRKRETLLATMTIRR